MERRPTTTRSRARNRSGLKRLLWIAGLAIVTISLIYFEQTALLYVLATFGVTVLLVIVAMADLSGAHKGGTALGDDAAALANAIPGSLPTAAAAATAIKPPATSSRRPRSKRR
jgi:hypothetical protein